MKFVPLLTALAVAFAGCTPGKNAVASKPALATPSAASHRPPPSHDGRVHLRIYVGPDARPERIEVIASLGQQTDRAAIAKARASFVATPMSVQTVTFSP